MALDKLKSSALDTNIDVAGTLDVTGDFTADSSNSTLFVDASTNRVHIGGGTSDTNTSALSVRKSGAGNFIANFENTSTTTPYGVMVRDPSGSAAGYPLLQVSNSGGQHFFRVDSNTGKHYFAPGGTEKVRIDSDGLKFNGDTAAANALDDYEEGTWTPYTGSGSWTVNSATYTKIGHLVTCTFDLTATSGIAASDFTGLPFTPNINSAGVIGYQNSESGEVFGILVQSSNIWNFRVGSTQKGLVNGALVRGMFTYTTNS
jgi:hypothetical protein